MSVRGFLLPTPGIAFYATSLENLLDSKDKFVDMSDAPRTEQFKPTVSACKDIEELQSILTWRHETCHYAQFLTTGFGHSLWQIDVWLIDHTLTAWRDSGYSPEIDDSAISDVSKFHQALWDRSQLSMQEFVDLANRAHAWVAQYWGTDPPRWSAKVPNRESYLPENGCTSREVIEGMARHHELLNLTLAVKAGLSPSLIEDWLARGLFGEYAHVCAGLVIEVGELITSAAVADEALCGEMFVARQNASIVVEEVLPSWRLEALVDGVRDAVLPWSAKKRLPFVRRDIARSVGIPSSVDTSSRRRKLAGLGLKMPPKLPDDAPLYDEEFRVFVVDRFRRSFGWRVKAKSPVVPVDLEVLTDIVEQAGLQPLIEVFSDVARMNSHFKKVNSALLLKCWAELCRSTVADAILSESMDAAFLVRLEFSVLSRFDDELVRSLGADARSLVSSLVGAAALPRLNMM